LQILQGEEVTERSGGFLRKPSPATLQVLVFIQPVSSGQTLQDPEALISRYFYSSLQKMIARFFYGLELFLQILLFSGGFARMYFFSPPVSNSLTTSFPNCVFIPENSW
jgi:hypothetical protein